MVPVCSEFNGKVIIVTGGNKGIGAGCCEAFCRAGATVVAGARDRETGEPFAARITDQGPGTCSFFVCDVSEHLHVKELIDSTVEAWGRIDCIVNNAGYLPKRSALDDVSIEDFEKVLRTNFLGLFAGCKYALPHLRKTRGSIINMGSILGITGQDGSTMYTATKGAISAFTKSLALDEAKHGVRVNCILPGNIKTGLGKQNSSPLYQDSEAGEARSALTQWIRRAGTSLEIGWVALFLASSMASYITGTELVASGGFELGNGIRLDREELLNIKTSLPGDAFPGT